MLAKGIDINATNMWGDTALIEACQWGSLKIVKLLLEAGYDVNFQSKAKKLHPLFKGYTPLMHAAENGYLEIVEILLANGANVNIKNKAGLKAVDCAIHGIRQNYIVDEARSKIIALLQPADDYDIRESFPSTSNKYCVIS